MNQEEMETILRQTLDDQRLSRSEKRALAEVLADITPSEADLAWLRYRAFELAREAISGHKDLLVLEWLEQIVKVLARGHESTSSETMAEAYFTPGHDATARLVGLLRAARRNVEICVFTITDDRLTSAILDAHRRGVSVRIVTDDEKAFDRGSDIDRLFNAGLRVRTDSSGHHMHHKFAIFDSTILVTGSYNWTRSASANNQENFVVLEEPRLIKAFSRTFEQLWKRFEDSPK